MTNLLNTTVNSVQHAYDYYQWTLSFADSRTKGWLLVDSPVPSLCLILGYLGMVFVGPKIMQERKPMKLTGLLILHNVFMTSLNAYICIQLFVAATRLNYNYICQPCVVRYHPDELQITKAVWWYYFSKCLEFLDTFFFIVRKKNNQLTFLHVYHHATMFAFWWIGVKWVPSGSTFFAAMVNSGIHVVMYLYYSLAAMGPSVSKYLWWKKYLTMLQMIQFTGALTLGINGIRTGCKFPIWMHYTLIGYMLSFIVLFGRFYVRSYMKEGHRVLFSINLGCQQTASQYPEIQKIHKH